MCQAMKGSKSEFQNPVVKKKALEADVANELELELERQEVEEKVEPEKNSADSSPAPEAEKEPVEKEVEEASVVEKPMEEKAQDPTLAQPGPQVKKGSVLSGLKKFIDKMKKAVLRQ